MARPTSNAIAHTSPGASPAPMTAMDGKSAITLTSSTSSQRPKARIV
jgi:hypothetical protein